VSKRNKSINRIIVLESYPVRIPDQYQELVFNELLLANSVINAILDIKWSEFKQKQKFKMENQFKAYIELGGYKVDDKLFKPFYLRNRFVRCVYEHVGRILRSLDERFEIYKYMIDKDFIGAIADDEPYEVYDLLKELYEKYNEILVDQEFRHLRNVVKRRFTKFKDKDIRNFFEVTKPELKSYVLDLAADSDNNLCKILWDGTYLHIKLCVPKSPLPTKGSGLYMILYVFIYYLHFCLTLFFVITPLLPVTRPSGGTSPPSDESRGLTPLVSLLPIVHRVHPPRGL